MSIASGVGHSTAKSTAVVTKPRSLSPIISLALCGPPGSTDDPTTATGEPGRLINPLTSALHWSNLDHDQRIGPRRGKAGTPVALKGHHSDWLRVRGSHDVQSSPVPRWLINRTDTRVQPNRRSQSRSRKLRLTRSPYPVLDDCKPGVGDVGIASNRLDAVPIAFRYLPGHRPRRSAPRNGTTLLDLRELSLLVRRAATKPPPIGKISPMLRQIAFRVAIG